MPLGDVFFIQSVRKKGKKEREREEEGQLIKTSGFNNANVITCSAPWKTQEEEEELWKDSGKKRRWKEGRRRGWTNIEYSQGIKVKQEGWQQVEEGCVKQTGKKKTRDGERRAALSPAGVMGPEKKCVIPTLLFMSALQPKLLASEAAASSP